MRVSIAKIRRINKKKKLPNKYQRFFVLGHVPSFKHSQVLLGCSISTAMDVAGVTTSTTKSVTLDAAEYQQLLKVLSDALQMQSGLSSWMENVEAKIALLEKAQSPGSHRPPHRTTPHPTHTHAHTHAHTKAKYTCIRTSPTSHAHRHASSILTRLSCYFSFHRCAKTTTATSSTKPNHTYSEH